MVSSFSNSKMSGVLMLIRESLLKCKTINKLCYKPHTQVHRYIHTIYSLISIHYFKNQSSHRIKAMEVRIVYVLAVITI